MAANTSIEWLADGRAIAFDAVGPEDGVPTFFCHTLPGSRVLPPWAEAATEKAGVRLISPDRPGIGFSDFQPGRALLDWPKDIAELADRLGIERFRLFGVSAGSPYVLATCVKVPERVARAAIACGLTPRDEADVVHKILPSVIDAGVKRSRLASWLVRRLFVTGIERSSERAAQALKATLPPCDQQVIDRPEVSDFVLGGTIEAAHRGLRGWVHDDRILNQPWGFAPADVPERIPVDLWWGEEDTTVPLAHAELLASELPRATLRVRPGIGHFGILVGHGLDDILTQLASDDC